MDKIKCIYAIKDKRNDKVIYVGMTTNLELRKDAHFCTKSSNIAKYLFEQGRDNFEMIVLEYFEDNITIKEMRKKEDDYILKFNTIKEGLNKIRSGNIEIDNLSKYNQDYKQTDKWQTYVNNYYKQPEIREHINQYRKNRFHNDPVFKEKQIQANRKYRLKKKLESQDK